MTGVVSIPKRALAGTARAASTLVLGTSSFGVLERAAPVYDRFVARGGSFFDTARVYGESLEPGCCERTLGAWMKRYSSRQDLVILGKGGHPPEGSLETIALELEESLDRLNTEYLDLYMLHRDSPAVPAGEFVDIMCALLNSGRIHAYGFSNWTLERAQSAWRYAEAKRLPAPAALSNNLSLAVMERPIYPGCVSASGQAFREWLAERACTLIPWSSQGRGVFTAIVQPEDLRSSHLADCWYSQKNVERIRRVRWLAHTRGVLPVNIALAWVLQQPFPVFPIIGPRSVDELESSLGALEVSLSNDEMVWLNLEDDGSKGATRAEERSWCVAVDESINWPH